MEETLGKRIVSHRKRLGLTQDQLAERLGITAQAVSKWENDQSCPDITTLPKLAEIFGTTTDALLGIVCEPTAQQAEYIPPENHESDHFQFRNGNWEVNVNTSRRGGIFFAAFLLMVGAVYLVSSLLRPDIGLWEIVWPSALLMIGLHGIYPKFSFLSLGFLIFGSFFLVNQFIPIPIRLDSGIIIAVIILLIGGGLLMDALKKPKKSPRSFAAEFDSPERAGNNPFHIEENNFQYNGAMGQGCQLVTMPLLHMGEINTAFGDYELDLSGILEISPDCRLEANTSFGDLTILVPSKFKVQCASNAAFANVEIDGKPDPVPAGTITFVANVSFGQITIEYI